jgi:hypothetical protein
MEASFAMSGSRFSDRLIRDSASEFLCGKTSQERRPKLAVNRLPLAGPAFTDEERDAVFRIVDDHSRYKPK